MTLHRIRKGLDLFISDPPTGGIQEGDEVRRVAFMGDDFHGLKPRVGVSVGQEVRRGELLCEDSGTPGVRHTSPGAGRIESINRGPRRALHSIVVALSDGETRGSPRPDEVEWFTKGASEPDTLGRAGVTDLLVRSGMWAALRTRPFSKVPDPASVPAAVFVNGMDTNPLAANPEVVLAEALEDFELGLRAVAQLSETETFLCVREGSEIAGRVDAPVSVEAFSGPHPAGTAGVHVHLLKPVSRDRWVWTIGYQDVVSIGRLLQTGGLDVSRVISLAGPVVEEPRLVRTRVGASVADLTARERGGEGVRWVSGSALSGKAAEGAVFGYMGRSDLQLCGLPEGGERELLAWLAPGRRRYSVLPAFASNFFDDQGVRVSTDAYGSRRAMIPLGLYERVMPLDVLPTFLLRALAVTDTERAEELGCLELDEEDLALCSFVDPGKADFGPMLRRTLDQIEKAG